MILKIPYEAYFQVAYVSVVITFIFIFTDTCRSDLLLLIPLTIDS